MITPRRTRLCRVPDLHRFQQSIVSLVATDDPRRARGTAVVVPSRAAALQLRHTIESVQLTAPPGIARAIVLPDIVTRRDWYVGLHERASTAGQAPDWLSELEREVTMEAAVHAAAVEAPPPFGLRPGVVGEIVRLYDDLRRLGREVADFERLLTSNLEGDAAVDRGAGRLLQQTQFLVRCFREYEHRVSRTGAVDEHGLRRHLLQVPLEVPYVHLVVTVADQAAEPEGLWSADYDLLTRLPGVETLDVVATEHLLATGFLERIHEMLPGIVEVSPERLVPSAVSVTIGADTPDLVVPEGAAGAVFESRDREDELAAVVRRIKLAPAPAPLDRVALVFKRPLPYVYLAQRIFEAAGVPYQTMDALPLAAEPYAAAVDLVFDAVASDFSRRAVVALLRSPHFAFRAGERRLGGTAVRAFDGWLAEAGYGSGADRLRDLLRTLVEKTPPEAPPDRPVRSRRGRSRQATPLARTVGATALTAIEHLRPLGDEAPASEHLARLRSFLRAHARPPAPEVPDQRDLRARAAIHHAIESLASAYQRIEDRRVDGTHLAGIVRRWIEGQTFAPRAGSAGVHVLDAQAARFGLFEDVTIVGLVESDWPERSSRNVFYPTGLLRDLGWPEDAFRRAAARAAFIDLLHLAHRRVAVSTVLLEEDTIVNPSVFLEDVDALTLARTPVAQEKGRVFREEALVEDPVAVDALPEPAAAWLRRRRSRTPAADPVFHGRGRPVTGERFSVGALETYLECPFKFFARYVLQLEEPPEDEEAQRPKRRGLFLHRVFQRFFDEWGKAGRGAITLDDLPQARATIADVAEPLLAELPDHEAALERERLFGNAASEGVAEIVCRVEAESGVPVVERLLEHRLDGEFEMRTAEGPRRVRLTGVADRIDLLDDGTIRVIDYKSGRAPAAKRMLQVPVYSVCAVQQLDGRHGRAWRVGESGYIAFRDPRRFVPLADRPEKIDDALGAAQARVLTAVDGIADGQFAPTPLEPFRCTFCPYASVCRKDYVGDD